MSTFMEHIHRDIDTLAWWDDETALSRPVESDLAASDNERQAGPVRAVPPGVRDAGAAS